MGPVAAYRGEFVSLTIDQEIAVIRLDRAPLNLLNTQATRELAAAAQAAAARDACAVVVHGGDKIFSAGDDVAELGGFTDQLALARDAQIALGCLAATALPVVAAISCYALGSGLEVALAADRRITGDNAKLGMPQVRDGISPRGGGTQRLRALAGPAVATDLVLTGRFVQADEARALGIVDEVVAPDDVYHTAYCWAEQFQGRDRAAIAAAKAALAGDYATERAEAAGLLSR